MWGRPTGLDIPVARRTVLGIAVGMVPLFEATNWIDATQYRRDDEEGGDLFRFRFRGPPR